MASYRIKSIDTKFLVAHSGLEHPGQPVISDDGEPHAPPLHHVCCLHGYASLKLMTYHIEAPDIQRRGFSCQCHYRNHQAVEWAIHRPSCTFQVSIS